MSVRIPFMHLRPGEDGAVVDAAIRRVVDRGWYVLGPEVESFEQAFAAATESRFAAGVGTGTDALALIMRALGIGPGDEVITTPLSAAYTALAVMMVGALLGGSLGGRLAGDGPRHGRAEVSSLFKEVYSKIKPIEIKPEHFTAQNDYVIVEGSSRGMANATGCEFFINWVMVCTLSNGKIKRFRKYYDTAELSNAFLARCEVRKAA